MTGEPSSAGLFRRIVAIALCEVLTVSAVSPAANGAQQAASNPPDSLRSYLQKPYLELFELAPTLHFSPDQVRAQREAFTKAEEGCVNRFKQQSKDYEQQIEKAQSELRRNTTKMTDPQRNESHCKIQNLDLLKSEADLLGRQAIPTAYDNLNAKLDLIEKWPALYRQTQQEIATEAYLRRKWADVKDIGFREIESDQQDDVKTRKRSKN